MPTINKSDLVRMMQAASNRCDVDYKKEDIYNAIQGIDDFMSSNKLTLSTAIDASTKPMTFTNEQKKVLVEIYLNWKAENY